MPLRRVPQRSPDDCFQACLASVLGVALEEVPGWRPQPEMGDYIARVDAWLATRGLAIAVVKQVPEFIGPGTVWIAHLATDDPNWHHAVVMSGEGLAWDPEGHRDYSTEPRALWPSVRASLFIASRRSPGAGSA